jgi:hypothetical protein
MRRVVQFPTGKSMGFGVSADEEPPMLFLPGVRTTMWGGPVRNLADQLGVELDEVPLRGRARPDGRGPLRGRRGAADVIRGLMW